MSGRFARALGRVRDGGRGAESLETSRAELADAGRTIETLSESAGRYRLLAENSTDVIAVSDAAGVLTYISPACRGLFGYEPEELIGRSTYDFVHPDDLEKMATAHAEALGSDEILTVSYRCRRRSGSYAWVETRVRQLADESTGEVSAFQATSRDITDRKRAEEELKLLAARLEQSNHELDDFAVIASHDLREPLHKIHAFGERLESRYGDALDDEGRYYLERMLAAEKRMQDLIDKLLTLSQVRTSRRSFTAVDLDQSVRDVLSDLDVSIDESGGRVECGGLPTVEADAVQMRELLQNLISNSIKFRREEEPLVVKIYGRVIEPPAEESRAGTGSAKQCLIFVEDNGIGFDERDRERIFTAFERLHARGNYDGTGIGLAICKRIAARHGGDITAYSTPGRGSTFVVSLPLAQRAHEPAAAGG